VQAERPAAPGLGFDTTDGYAPGLTQILAFVTTGA
jgi:hypothetical protein